VRQNRVCLVLGIESPCDSLNRGTIRGGGQYRRRSISDISPSIIRMLSPCGFDENCSKDRQSDLRDLLPAWAVSKLWRKLAIARDPLVTLGYEKRQSNNIAVRKEYAQNVLYTAHKIKCSTAIANNSHLRRRRKMGRAARQGIGDGVQSCKF
jgi:hypothetical protein